jgi:hypothetical protein
VFKEERSDWVKEVGLANWCLSTIGIASSDLLSLADILSMQSLGKSLSSATYPE